MRLVYSHVPENLSNQFSLCFGGWLDLDVDWVMELVALQLFLLAAPLQILNKQLRGGGSCSVMGYFSSFSYPGLF